MDNNSKSQQNQPANQQAPAGRPNLRSQKNNYGNTNFQEVPVETTPEPKMVPPPAQEVAPPVQAKMELAGQEDAVMTSAENQEDKKMNVEDEAGASGELGAARRRILGLTKKKISNKERRIRQNRRLRKMLTPKNAITALHELQGPSTLDFMIAGVNNDFRAEVNVNSVKYVGQGRSKVLAKNNAAEKALRDFVIAKMAAKARRVKEEKSIEAGEAEMKEGTEQEEVDDVPMLNLVSFALHKLFTEWEAEGFTVPDFRNGQEAVQQMVVDGANGAEQPVVKTLPAPREELPPNAAATHPTMLLSIMSPGTQFVDVGSEGKPPNVVHTVSVSLNGKNYVGTGRTKKIARKNAAMEACMDRYGVKFNPDIVEAS